MISILKVDNLNIAYGNLQVVWDVSLNIPKGQIVALLGSNGAGKTTILKTIGGILKPMSGKIFFADKDLSKYQSHQLINLGLCFVPEDRNLFISMTVEDNLVLGAYTIRNKAKIKSNLEYVYSLFPRLFERKKQLAGTMSGGERQMLAIARGLMANPKMIMLDEPSMGLSPQNVVLVFETLKKLKKENVTTLIVEQNVNTTLEISDSAYVLEHGKIVMFGDSNTVKNDDGIRKMYLGIA